jgi:NitT/TauT family transport system ATP-binding protein
LLRIHADRKYTTFFVTHNISESIFLADKVVVMSPRPGRVSAVIDVPFDRPREPALKHTPEFGELAQRAGEILGSEQ